MKIGAHDYVMFILYPLSWSWLTNKCSCHNLLSQKGSQRQAGGGGGGTKPTPQPVSVDSSQQLMTDALEKAKRAAAIQARINASMANVGLGGGLLASLGAKGGGQVKTEPPAEQETKPAGVSAAATANLPGG